MGDPSASYAALMSLRAPAWPGYCLKCGRPVARRWWQRGILTPFPLCRKGTCR